MGCGDALDPFGLFGPDEEELQKSNAKAAIKQSQGFYDQFLAQFVEPAEAEQDMLWDIALGYAEDVPGMIEEGYDRAALGVDRMVSAGRSDILDQGENLAADMDMAMAASGLYGSTAHAGAVQGVSSGTQRALARLYADGAGETARIEAGRTSGLVGASQNLSSLNMGRAGHDLSFLQSKLNAAMGAPVFAQAGGPHPALSFGVDVLDAFMPG